MSRNSGLFANCAESKASETATGSWFSNAFSPRKSVIQIHFPKRNMTLSYYNDQFDLKRGDFVYVDGKLEGILGRVIDVNYNFKINLSEYQRVIATVDTEVHGQFFLAGSHFVTFDPAVLPVEKIEAWFKAPCSEDDEIVSGTDDTSFPLDNLNEMNVSYAVFQRGRDYYFENKVKYLCVDDTHGRAFVEGTKNYDVEFDYYNGEISALTCSCFCNGGCKHEVAAMLQLRELLECILKHYQEEYNDTGYFAAVQTGTLFQFAIDGKETGRFTI